MRRDVVGVFEGEWGVETRGGVGEEGGEGGGRGGGGHVYAVGDDA